MIYWHIRIQPRQGIIRVKYNRTPVVNIHHPPPALLRRVKQLSLHGPYFSDDGILIKQLTQNVFNVFCVLGLSVDALQELIGPRHDGVQSASFPQQ